MREKHTGSFGALDESDDIPKKCTSRDRLF